MHNTKHCMQEEEDLDDKKEGAKYLAAMVRDGNRLKLVFPELSELLETHRTVEAWMDRANIAIRSRISLTEIKTLLETGEKLPVNLSDLMEKLNARVSLAEDWVNQFKQIVPSPEAMPGSANPDKILLHWTSRMRETLRGGSYTVLHDLASEGSRIPVEVDIVKLLQIEIDAKNWSMKAKKWVPHLAKEENITCKRGKLEDLREHMEKAALLHEKLCLPPSVKNEWTMDGENDIRSILEAADDWFEKVRIYVDVRLFEYLEEVSLTGSTPFSTNLTWTGIIAELKVGAASLWIL